MKKIKEYKNHQPAKSRRISRLFWRQIYAEQSQIGTYTWHASDKRRGNTRIRLLLKYLELL